MELKIIFRLADKLHVGIKQTACINIIFLGCRDNGLTFALNAQMWTVQLPILNFGTETQKQKYLPGMCRGKLIGAHGITEPDSGSDVFSLRTHAEKRDDGYLLNGTK